MNTEQSGACLVEMTTKQVLLENVLTQNADVALAIELPEKNNKTEI